MEQFLSMMGSYHDARGFSGAYAADANGKRSGNPRWNGLVTSAYTRLAAQANERNGLRQAPAFRIEALQRAASFAFLGSDMVTFRTHCMALLAFWLFLRSDEVCELNVEDIMLTSPNGDVTSKRNNSLWDPIRNPQRIPWEPTLIFLKVPMGTH